VSLQGFVCPLNGTNVGLGACVTCPSPCTELPILFALLQSDRKVSKDRFSVTESYKPPQVLALERKHDYWVDPMKLVWQTFGTSWHAMIERQREAMAAYGRKDKEYTFEAANHFECDFDVDGQKVIVHGTPDQYHHPSGMLTDYKTLKYYWDVAYLMKGDWKSSHYGTQVNLYRYFEFPLCNNMQLVALVKDWNRKLAADKGVPPIVRFTVPRMKDKEIEDDLRTALRDHLVAQDDITKVRPCTADERWKDSIRCEEYCPCNQFCRQYMEARDEKGANA